MENKIWTYGCSFTSGYNELLFSNKTWPYLLNLQFDYYICNRARGGGSFYDVRENIIQDIGNINKNDIIILQLPTSNRVVVPYFKDEWRTFMKIRTEHPEGTIGWIKYMKEVEELKYVLAEEAFTIFDLLNRLNLKWVWWTAEKCSEKLDEKYIENKLSIGKYDNYEDWIFSNKEYWISETDWHQSLYGHEIMAKDFAKQINRIFNLNLDKLFL